MSTLGGQTDHALMNRRILPLVFAIPFAHALSAQVTVDWTQPVRGQSIALDPQNNVFTVDYEQAPAADIVLTKRNAAGTQLWTAAYDQTSTTRFDRATWVAADQLGNAVVTGTVMSGFSSPVNANSLVEKFSPGGSLLWRVVYESDFDGSSTRKCVVDKANNIYVLGLGTGPNGQVTTVKKFTPGGASVWSWFDVGIGGPINIKFTPDSDLVIVHRTITGNFNGYTRIDRDGNTLWNLTAGSLTVGDAAGDAFGNTYVVHANSGGAGSVIRKLSPTGALIWQNAYPITAFRVETGSDNAPVICGYPVSGSGGSAFLKADPNGTQLWLNADADGPNNFLLHAQLMLDPNNNAYLCAGTLFAMGICKVNSNGTTGWYVTAGTGGSQAFALGTDNNVYVVGGSTVRLGQPAAGVRISPRVLLEGPFVPGTGLMNDALRSAGLIPMAEPYTALGYMPTGLQAAPTTPGVLATSGNNAIVDHVLIELRSATSSTTVLASRTALVQRDGDVVDVDGVSSVAFSLPAASYFVAVQHRNHLGTMSASPIALSGTSTTVDFTSGSTPTYGIDGRKTIGSVRVLWAGDVTFNHQVKYTGTGNDRDPILVRVGSTTPNSTVNGYFPEDVNLDGVVKYTGTGNDRDLVLVTVGGTTPNAVRTAQLP